MHIVIGFTCGVFIVSCIIFLSYFHELVYHVKKIRFLIQSFFEPNIILTKEQSTFND